MKKTKILCVIGTRPEAIKMAPVILALQKEIWADVRVLATAQHRGMLDQVNDFFNITPDIDLDIMQPNQSLTILTSRLLQKLDDVFLKEKPDVVLVQGDTTTVMAVALTAFYHRVAIGHIEAGLRTWNINNPFPEEANRVVTSKFTNWHFAPTEGAKQNLIKDGINPNAIDVTGNTVIDALLMASQKKPKLNIDIPEDKRVILITSHRRENFGSPFENICRALQTLGTQNPDVQFLYPVHPNPNVKDVAYKFLAQLPNFKLVAPLDYAQFIAAMQRAYIILTDSGGVQEEAPALGKPVLVLRDETERPEAVEQGVVKLVGHDSGKIILETQKLLDDTHYYQTVARGISPYGDGHASARIIERLKSAYKQ